jgi:hypothetical protein
MSRKLVQAFIVSPTNTLPNIKKEIDQGFVENDIKLEELEVKKNIKGTFHFVALIKQSQSTAKIKKVLNKIGNVSWFVVITGKTATYKRHKKWEPKNSKSKNIIFLY